MNSYAKVYPFLDPILKGKPAMSFPELQQEHPEIVISYGAFNARKNKLLKSKKTAKRVDLTAPIDVNATTSTLTVKEAVEQLLPNSRLKKEYVKVGEILMKDPNAVHSHAVKEHKIKMCDANFYQFRRKFCTLMDLELTAQRVTGGKKKRKYTRRNVTEVPAVSRQKKRPSLYTVLYEQEATGVGAEAKELMSSFLDVLRAQRVLNAEMVEVIIPGEKKEHILEFRSY